MPLPSHQTPPEIPQRIRLLELAQRAPLYLSQDNQTYIECPTAIPVFSEDFFTWFICLAEKRLGSIPSPADVACVSRTLDAHARAAKTENTVYTRIAKLGTKSFQLDLGTEDHRVVNITGEGWELSQYFDAHFERLEDHKPMATPAPTPLKLAVCMEKQFNLAPVAAEKLAIWLAEALLPGHKPPILVITGKARETAVEKLRNLIDPVREPIIETPTQAGELRRMALENNVLAFSVNDHIAEKVLKALNLFHQGKRVLLKHCQRSRFKSRSTISRSIIIATEEPQQISQNQLNLEINEALDIENGKILSALLNLLVQIVGQPITQRRTMAISDEGEITAVCEAPAFDSS